MNQRSGRRSATSPASDSTSPTTNRPARPTARRPPRGRRRRGRPSRPASPPSAAGSRPARRRSSRRWPAPWPRRTRRPPSAADPSDLGRDGCRGSRDGTMEEPSTGGSGTLNGRRRHVGQRTRSGPRWARAGTARRGGPRGGGARGHGLVACGPPPPPPPPWAVTTRTTPAGYVATDVGCAASREVGALEAFVSRRVGPVLGWDYQHVYPLGANRWLWLFQDAFIDHTGLATRLDGSGFAHNARSCRPGTASRCSTGDRRAARRPSSPVTAKRR